MLKELLGIELASLRTWPRFYLLYPLFALACSISTSMMPVAYLILAFTLLTPFVTNVAEEGKAAFTLALPVSRRQIVREKYLLTAAGLGALTLVMAALNRLFALVLPPFLPERLNGMDLFTTCAAMTFATALFMAILHPMILALGYHRGRYAVTAVYLLAFFSLFNLVTWNNRIGRVWGLPPAANLALLACAAAALAVSYQEAAHLYETREF